MTGTTWNDDRASANAAAGVKPAEQLALGTHNGRLAYLQEDGLPLMYVDDFQELC